MNVHFEVGHPAHVHLFKHAIWDLEEAGHETLVTAREKEVTTELLDAYGIDYQVLSRQADSTPGLILEWALRELKLVRAIREFGSDVVVSHLSPVAAQAARLTGTPSVTFTDDEVETRTLERLTVPFTARICTPANFEMDFGRKHRRYDGYHELAYLHPDRFDPDPEQLREHGVAVDEPYYVLRFVSWEAHHDVGNSGFSREAKRELVEYLSGHGEVYITSESELPEAFEEYRLPVPPETIHDLLYYADGYVGDSQTMAMEAGLLGTPSIRSNSFVGDDDVSMFGELEAHGLVFNFREEGDAVAKLKELVEDPETAAQWEGRRERLLETRVDVTDVVLEEALGAAE
ncbi:DUF354 domain-containing protein [Haloarcula nitratireducens]|uniref:DUF354 domain-containing protein n=1 Tax=Haloarcula nitratireducens TaxID=2487749 RepID=A0AAW4P8I2_9EURY|nr:DUF354 domain-containing protein [Halomicroarcula nitratireducens]MBX0294056.1 DUF354 domain-containing protein [Halomicroarcula nitratireducens]